MDPKKSMNRMDPKKSKLLHGGSGLLGILDFDKPEHDKPPSPVKLLHALSSSGTVSPRQSILDFNETRGDDEEWRKLMKLLPDYESFLYQPGEAILSKPPVRMEVKSDPFLSYSESGLQQYCQEKGAEYHLDRVTNSKVFRYGNHRVYHFNLEARLQNPVVAEPSMKLFFVEVMVPYHKPGFITCFRAIEPMDGVTEGCIFCCGPNHVRVVIHPISNVVEVDKRLTPVEHNPYKHNRYDKGREMVMSFSGIPPWQLNRGQVQIYRDIVRSREEKQNIEKIQLRRLSEAVLVVLKKRKGMYLKLVKGLRYRTFKCGEHTFHHLNFEAKLHHDNDGLSTRMYFTEMINHVVADRVTVCCVIDPADGVLEKCALSPSVAIMQPDLRCISPKNVIYVNVQLCQEIYSEGLKFPGFPCMFPGWRRSYVA